MAVQSSWKGTRCAVTRQEYSARAKIIPHSGSKNHHTSTPRPLGFVFYQNNKAKSAVQIYTEKT